jgi:hypothetical protein
VAVAVVGLTPQIQVKMVAQAVVVVTGVLPLLQLVRVVTGIPHQLLLLKVITEVAVQIIALPIFLSVAVEVAHLTLGATHQLAAHLPLATGGMELLHLFLV